MAEHHPQGRDPRAAARRRRMLRRRRRSIFGTVTLLFAVLAACQVIAATPNEAENVVAGDPTPSPTRHPAGIRAAHPTPSTADPTPSAVRPTPSAARPTPSTAAPSQSAADPTPSAVGPTPGGARSATGDDLNVLHPRPWLQVKSASGRLRVVAGTGPIVGRGPVKRYVVEVERGLPEDPQGFAAEVARILGDPRSWGHDGAMSFQRVSSGPVDFRVTLASPAETDRLCAVAGLDTQGDVSCFNGERSVINQNRWETGVPWFDGNVTLYRDYVINHEVGHALGHHHEHCPAPGELAPVMQEQTYTLEGCRKNGWPYPDAG